MKIDPMPPLNSLVAFEAAARHLSFTVAAAELNVTQGAISRQVRLLEDYLGTPLFERTTRRIVLSSKGEQYYRDIHDVLTQLARATGAVRHWKGAQQVTVFTSTALASMWLLPRVAEFQRQNEEIELRIIANDQAKDFSRLDCDLAVFYSGQRPEGIHATPLFAEEVFPVCSPEYLAKHPGLAGPEQLCDCTWLWLEDPQSGWIGWAEWYRRTGHVPVEPRRRININSYAMLIQSAVAGQGIALAWANLVDRHLETGALVRPIDAALRTSGMFYLLEPEDRGAWRPSVRRFRAWLLEQVAGADS
ncbi:LysR substrate-binding domain-containing protein [Pseudoduganella umbonata]|uniref:DNA-binding transcriptional LysR family regulator n=1 Tax=Pseudoduganella umbonata TaxID=864828 RepID=A0A4P8HLS0_9BURK|nr:LysR substrate-binding domain-containing protein [Pseudoduganella umbonata]MBB3224962.1 DNA-binding transcriptional LysR family regulator [Pseudoduganella umbonata]QCP09238.1 LysR family transcriptional regulator [Pseudoduganella umbonata]